MEVGLFLIHAVVGVLIAAHGSQKLFGWFGGAGLEGAGGMMESLGLVPGRPMAAAAGAAEFAGGHHAGDPRREGVRQPRRRYRQGQREHRGGRPVVDPQCRRRDGHCDDEHQAATPAT